MRVLMISLDGSILNQHSASASRMREYGFICNKLHIIVLGRAGKKIQLGENIFVHPTSSKRIISLIISLIISFFILNKKNKWIITVQHPFEGGLIGWFLSKIFKTGFEVQLHGDFYGNFYWRKERLLNRVRYYLGKFVLHRAKSIRVVSQRIKDSIRPFLKKDIKIFRNPIYLGQLSSYLVERNGQNNYPIILAVGNLVPVKNHKQLIEVFAGVKRELPNAKLVIVGKGTLEKDLQVTSDKLRANVELVGAQKDLSKFYNNSDIFVHPSLYEGWGRVLIEAAHHKLSIIMTNVGLAGEIIKNEESGLVVPVKNKEALKKAILRLARDKDLQKRLADNAKKEVVQIMSTKEEYLIQIKESWNNSFS